MNKMKIGFILVLTGLFIYFFLPPAFAKKKSEPPPPPAPAAAPASAAGFSFEQMMDQLSQNMLLWKSLSENDKAKAIDTSINFYKNRENSAILNSPTFYVKKVDETLQSNPDVLNISLLTAVKLLAVMEYDFYNGQNKDDLAKQMLGEKTFEANKMRLRTEAMQGR